MKIIKVKDYKEMSDRAAGIVIKEIKKKPNLVLGCATGRTQIGLYKRLVKAYKRGEIDFSKVKTFNLDEYYPIKKSDRRSYHYAMFKRLFNKVNIKKSNVHILNGEAKDWKKECESYERKIRKNPIDVQILGIGVNAHIGFNIPGSGFNSRTRLVHLKDVTIERNSRFVGRKVPKTALTMGIKTIMKAKKIVLLASGRDKRDAIHCLIKGKIGSSCPASFLRKHRNFTLIVDKRALG
jgi:glucosamine-6-phosphate deaminase